MGTKSVGMSELILSMKIKKIASLTALLAAILMLLTAFVLYIVPHGRIANWADWHLLGLNKSQWENIHLNFGLLFLIALGVHIYYNWKPIMSYMKDKAKRFKLFTKEFNFALILIIIFGLGTYFEVPPFSSFLALSESIKDGAAEKYGNPPYGHAELSSLKTFAKRTGIDVKQGLEYLNKNGCRVKNEMQTLAEIGRINNISPQQVYDTMKPATGTSSLHAGEPRKLPDAAPGGMGNLTLADLCSQFNLNMRVITRGLGKQNIKAREDMTLRQIAEKNQISPIDVYEGIKAIAATDNSVQTSGQKMDSKEGNTGGMGLGRMTLVEVCEKNSVPIERVIQKLSNKGIKASPEDKMKKVASALNTTPLELVELIKKVN